MLLHLVSDYIRNVNDVQDRFARNPLLVIEEYGLSAIEAREFGNAQQLAARVASEIGASSKASFRALTWGVPDITVTQVEPGAGTVGTALTLVISGADFNPNVRVAFQAPGAPRVEARTVRFVDAHTVEATAVLPLPGYYAVGVYEDTTPPHGGWLEGALEITA